ncbi:hypothetical protein D9758_009697 [Tetrapyrgos nigripes]|uniref:F-box domain-containing protein n=1 Tax=Tetrapyrgos nigripes TaxID=182062 RepID=A0A8H5CPQ0_9AGAR|nr:hypothetical protein D9758_009697 [Tetrapyrgos nigripes]
MGFFDYFDQEHLVSFDLAVVSKSSTLLPARLPPSAASRALPHLPLELVLLIFQHANDKYTYLSSSLVCRAWSLPAQQFLFNHVSLSSQSACLSFIDTISASPALASSVQTLSASIDHNQPFGLSQLSFAHAFAQCPNITDLRISLYGCAQRGTGKDIVGIPDVARMRRLAPSWDQETLELLRVGGQGQVKKLRFSNWSENRTSLNQLLEVFEELDELVIVGTSPEVPTSSSASGTPLPPSISLSSLRINIHSRTHPSPDYLSWLLHTSSTTSSLRSITFDRVPPAPVLDFVLNDEGISKGLEELRVCGLPPVAPATNAVVIAGNAAVASNAAVSTSNPKAVESILTTLSSLPRLKTLSIEQPASFLRVLLTKSLPPSIEHLAFGLEVEDPSLSDSSTSSRGHARSTSLAVPQGRPRAASHARSSSLSTLPKLGINQGPIAGGPVGMKTLVQTIRNELEDLKSLKVLLVDSDDDVTAGGVGVNDIRKSESKWLASLKMVCAQRGVEVEFERDVRRWRESFQC